MVDADESTWQFIQLMMSHLVVLISRDMGSIHKVTSAHELPDGQSECTLQYQVLTNLKKSCNWGRWNIRTCFDSKGLH
jgi:hypothetical protein